MLTLSCFPNYRRGQRKGQAAQSMDVLKQSQLARQVIGAVYPIQQFKRFPSGLVIDCYEIQVVLLIQEKIVAYGNK